VASLDVTDFALNELENGGQLVPNVGAAFGVDRSAGGGSGAQPVVRLRGQLHPAPRTRLHRAVEPLHCGLCHHYGVELHNFAPNAISQAATFVGVCEGFCHTQF
jgi:hypothetical protein